MKYFQGSRGGALLSGAQRCELRLLGLRCREGQVQRQDGAGEAEGVGDELRRAGEGGRQDHLHGEFSQPPTCSLSQFCAAQVHDEVKDKMFEPELSWVGEFTGGLHKRVPDNVSSEQTGLV